jgi:N-acetylglucosaminyl-diphospho-decaprenol L-rhamnosyltransferase
MDGAPIVSVIVVSYRVPDEVRGCLEDLRASGFPLEVFLVDNASHDGTREMVEAEFASWPALRARFLEENVGLAAANNVPLHEISGRYVLILNPDTVPTRDVLERLTAFMEARPDIGVVGPRQLYQDGTPHSSFHRGWGVAHIALWSTVPRRLLGRWYDSPRRLVEQEVSFVSGACMMLRAELFKKIGGYDPGYFLAVEDALDVCARVRALGYRAVYYPGAEIVHYGARSNGQARALSQLKGSQGHLYHIWKWGGPASLAATYLILAANSLARAVAYYGLSVFAADRYLAHARTHAFVLANLHRGVPRPPAGTAAGGAQAGGAEVAGRVAGEPAPNR